MADKLLQAILKEVWVLAGAERVSWVGLMDLRGLEVILQVMVLRSSLG